MDPFQENQIELIEIRVIILSSEKETYFGLGRLDTLFLRHGCCRLITVLLFRRVVCFSLPKKIREAYFSASRHSLFLQKKSLVRRQYLHTRRPLSLSCDMIVNKLRTVTEYREPIHDNGNEQHAMEMKGGTP